MKTILTCTAALLMLSACGSSEKTTVVHERPVVVNSTPHAIPSPDTDSVESQCRHGYDNRTHSCY